MAERPWFMAVDGRQEGPLSDPQLKSRIAAGEVTPDTLLWTAGMSEWRRAISGGLSS